MEHHYSMSGAVPLDYPNSVIAVLDAGATVIYAGDPPTSSQDSDPRQYTPVYAIQGGSPAVPTGRVLVRFEEHLSAAAQQLAISTAGYLIEQILPYAPHAAWVTSASGEIQAALNAIPRLEALANVVNVEPQLVRPSIQRGAPAGPI
jgi:hypothetical protein